jgi:hypothetical protein
MKLATSTPIFASLAIAKEVKQVNQEMAVKRKSTAAQEIMLQESALVLLAETVDSCWVPFKEMPALMRAQ